MASLRNERTGPGYFSQGREDVLDLLPRGLQRVLDIGCGAGATAPNLRALGVTDLHGIELVPDAAAAARSVFDVVHEGPVEACLEKVDGPFDAILCLDLLEHLVDPYSVLKRVRDCTHDDGVLLVSLPNARNISLAFDLLVRGTFNYGPHGHRDWTHLRWFTRKDAIRAIETAGFRVERTATPPPRPWRRFAGLATRPGLELTTWQWYFMARAVPQ